MISAATDFFSNRMYGRQYQSLFERMAATITKEYIDQLHIHIEKYGCPPTFNDILSRVSALTNELKLKATWIREDYREGSGYRSVKLTTGCKRIIKSSVEQYLTQSKILSSIRLQQMPGI
ncbi:MAG: hypothetical protein JNK00_00135 [Flavipsychrobacter sp.]|nr:hypothetical protein [Flavipsychrobacter sp.]